ncbi:MAG: peptidoglycan editing factor PgeF [Alphaproteobacteria bacterium]|nr:peptidoglycan editing factor PgeF [Alphaproteobacteria bacterium]
MKNPVKKLPLPHLTHPDFQTDGMAYGFFTRAGGVSDGYFESLNCGLGSGDLLDNVYENHRRIAAEFSLEPTHLLFCKQIHSNKVITVTQSWERNKRPDADALVTTQKNIALAVMSADCAPVLFYEPHKKIIAAAHAGWKGALSGVLEETIAAIEQLGGNRESIQTCIGPCIQQGSYEVGPEFSAPFLAQSPSNETCFKPSTRARHFLFNLPGYIAKRLALSGIVYNHSIALDTVSNEKHFFSYRRAVLKDDVNNGVQMSVIVLS